MFANCPFAWCIFKCRAAKVIRALLLCTFFIFISENFLFHGHMARRGGATQHHLTPVDGKKACADPDPVGPAAWARGLTAILEDKSDDPLHGDVCRVPNGAWFCPHGCYQTGQAPWCVVGGLQAPVSGGRREACRVPYAASLAAPPPPRP